MKKLFQCRRTFIAFVGIVSLTVLGLCKGIDTSMAIAGICAALSGANAYESKAKPEDK
jgi:hypothetical protein